MKLFVTAATIAILAVPAAAQQAGAVTPSANAAAGGTTATTPAASLTLDTPLEALVANPKAKAVLDQVLQTDITQNPFYEQIKVMSFNQIQPLSNGQLSDETLKKIGEGLAAIK
ncbi:MAG: hypothetical protein A4S16_08420 [Proteobacteria bacterium SG_bin6]|nr:MAG: hypothetical protein A4S16_08420 [Proteobacteria bacterium SG_bin6]